MENNLFILGSGENKRIINLIRVIFGILCLALAIFWLIFSIKAIKTDGTLWITIIFLSGFGFYQIWSGMGRATQFIEISEEKIRIRKNSILPTKEMFAVDIEKIEIFPLNVIFFLKTQKRFLLRFGTVYYETNRKIVDGIIGFADSNKIPYETIEEEVF